MRCSITIVIHFALAFSFMTGHTAPPDVSDQAIGSFLQHSFQFDYTTITDDTSLGKLIEALDYQVAMINYRTILEKTAPNSVSPQGNKFAQQLDRRYQEILHDGYLYRVFSEWQNKTKDKTAKTFINLFLSDREQMLSYPSGMGQVRSLAGRISERLQKFHFNVDGTYYNVNDIRQLIATGASDKDRQLARRLVGMRRDSSAILIDDALLLYKMYNGMGLEKGGRTWQEFLFSPFSIDYPDWIKIAQSINSTTDNIYFTALDGLKEKHQLDDPTGYEIDDILNRQAILPDKYFTQEKINRAIKQLLENIGLSELTERLSLLEVSDATSYAAVIFRYPPDDILFVKPPCSGFARYYRLLSELGKGLPWVFADTTLPYLLRTYAPGTPIMTSELFITLGTDTKFLATNFDIPEEELQVYTEGVKFLNLYQIRKVTLHILFDNKLSSGKVDNPSELFWSLEKSIIGTSDSSYFWIDALVSGRIEKYPNMLAQAFGRLKMREVLHHQIGPDYAVSAETGRFLIDYFCRPGRTLSLEDFVESYSPDRFGVDDLKRQME